jgi:hypothetical protein
LLSSLLALDRAGRLIVAELKRDIAPDTVLVQTLNYAAMASRFNLDLLAEAYGARRGGDLSTAELQDVLREWAPALTDETLAPPRMVLVAEDFGPVLRNTAMFLIEQGLDLRLVRVQLYRMSNGTLALTARSSCRSPTPRNSWFAHARLLLLNEPPVLQRCAGRRSLTVSWLRGCSHLETSRASWCLRASQRTKRRFPPG